MKTFGFVSLSHPCWSLRPRGDASPAEPGTAPLTADPGLNRL
jgi:hypothetical protein